MLRTYKPDKVVELGTGNGILSLHFMTYCWFSGAEFLTIDVKELAIKELMEKHIKESPQCTFLKANIYDDSTMETVAEFLNAGERPFILVDGRDPKSDEVNLYAPLLKIGTVIFAHDCAIEGSKSKTVKKPKWCFEEKEIEWDYVERYEPFYSLGRDFDTRMLAMRKTSDDLTLVETMHQVPVGE